MSPSPQRSTTSIWMWKREILLLFWDTTVPANPRLQNTLTRSFCRAKARSGWMAGMSQRKRIHLRCVRLRVWYFRIRTTRSLRASWRRMSASDRKISACRRMRSGSAWKKALGAVGMLSYRHHSPNKLSGGQKQRVAIAGVMAMEPKCIVLDEPTAMLDRTGGRKSSARRMN